MDGARSIAIKRATLAIVSTVQNNIELVLFNNIRCVPMKVFLLSIRDSNVDAFLAGRKRWEFRANPRFGIGLDYSLVPGDVVFMVGHATDEAISADIRCMGVVKSILREAKFRKAFGDHQSELWSKTGWHADCGKSKNEYQEQILSSYAVAVEADPYRIDPAIRVTDIRHRVTGMSWKGIGFVPACSLKRYVIRGKEVAVFFRDLAERLVENG